MPENYDERKNVSKHILPTSSNLLGLCFILINFLKFWKIDKKIDLVLDRFVGIVAIYLVSFLQHIFLYVHAGEEKGSIL